MVHVYVNDIEVGNGNLLLVTMYEKDNILLPSILLIEMACHLVIHMVEMRRRAFFILQPWCGLYPAVHSLGSLIVTRIHLGSFDCISESIMSNIVLILHHGFFYLQPWVLFHVALWSPKSQGNWFDQIARICALVRQVSAQLIQFDSSTGDFSYENLIFLLSFGYYSDFLVMQLIVPSYVHDATIFVERKLTVTMAVRNVILGQLAEVVVGRFSSGDAAILIEIQCGVLTATTFVLADWLEVSADAHGHKKWLPEPRDYEIFYVCDTLLVSHWIY